MKLNYITLKLFTCFLLRSICIVEGSSPLLTYQQVCNIEDGYCYQAFSNATTYLDAWYQCHASGMHLLMPRTAVQMDFIRDNILGCNSHASVWLGLHGNSTDATWWWQDMVKLLDTDYNAWNYGVQSTAASSGTIANMTCGVIEKQRWDNNECNGTREYICQSYTKGCTLNSPYLFEDNCYQLITGQYMPSTSLCGNHSLAMPKTSSIDQYLNDINSGDENLWFGLYRPVGTNLTTFQWFDGDNVTSYTNFMDNTTFTMFWTSYFAYMTPNGQWDAMYAATYFNASFVCEYPLIKDCGPLNISNGITISENTTEGFVHTIECNVGLVSNVHSITCGNDGTWIHSSVCPFDGDYLCSCDYANLNVNDENLDVDVSELSITRRQMTSAWDDRVSAQCMGYVGAVILVTCCLSFIINDIINIFHKKK